MGIAGVTASSTAASTSIKALGGTLESLGKTLSIQVTAPLVAMGTAAFIAAKVVDEAMDSIRARTGALGDDLAGLGNDFRTVFAQVPQSAGDVAKAIGDLSVRMDLTGPPLQTLTTQLLNLARVTETDVSATVKSATQLFHSFGLSAAQQAPSLDFLFKVTQKTGISFGELSSELVSLGPIFRTAGIGFEQGALLLGAFQKSGVDASAASFGLRSALNQLSETGGLARFGVKTLSEGLEVMFLAIQNAKTETDAARLAFDFFGSRGIAMGEAIRRGALDVEGLRAKVAANTDTINKAAKDTESFGEQWGLLRNRLTTALAPMGAALHTFFSSALMPLFLSGIATLKAFADAFNSLPDPIKNAIVVFVGFTAAMGPLLFAIGATTKALAVLLPMLAIAAGPVGWAGLAVALLAAGGAFLYFNSQASAAEQQVAKLNAVSPALGATFTSLQAQLDKTFDPAKRAELQRLIDGTKALGADTMTTGGAVKLGALALDAYGVAAGSAGVALKNQIILTKEEQTSIDKLRQSMMELQLNEREREVAALTAAFAKSAPAVQAMAARLAEMAVALKELKALDKLGETLATLQLGPREQEVAALTTAFKNSSATIRERAEAQARLIVGTKELTQANDALIATLKEEEDRMAALPLVTLSRDLATTAAATYAAGVAASNLERASHDMGDGLDGSGEAMKRATEESLSLEKSLKAQTAAFGLTGRAADLVTTSYRLYERGLGDLNVTERNHVERMVDSQREGRRLAEVSALITRGYTVEQATSLQAAISQVNDRQRERVAAGDYFGFLGGAFELSVMQSTTWAEGLTQVASETFGNLKSFASDFLFDFVTGTLDAGKAFENFGKQLLRTITDFVAQQAVKAFLSFLFGGTGFSTGGLVGGAGAAGGGSLIAGLGGTTINSLISSSGSASGASATDVIPALLSKGEAVLSSETVQKMLAGDFSGLIDTVAGAGASVSSAAQQALANATTNFTLAGGGAKGVEAALTGFSATELNTIISAQQGAEFATANLGTTGSAGAISSGGLESGIGQSAGTLSGLLSAFNLVLMRVNDDRDEAARAQNMLGLINFVAPGLGTFLQLPGIIGGLIGKGGIFGAPARRPDADLLDMIGINKLGESIAAGRTPTLAAIQTAPSFDALAQVLGTDPATLTALAQGQAGSGYDLTANILTTPDWQTGGGTLKIQPVADPFAALLNPDNMPNYNPLGANSPIPDMSMGDWLRWRALNPMTWDPESPSYVRPPWQEVASFAAGGVVPGGSPYIDRIPGMLTPREFVVRSTVAVPNASALDQLNTTGEWPATLVAHPPELASARAGSARDDAPRRREADSRPIVIKLELNGRVIAEAVYDDMKKHARARAKVVPYDVIQDRPLRG